MKVVAVSGFFDPIHIGHVRYLQEAKKLGDTLLVIVNNDHQAELKKGEAFMRAVERAEIIGALGCVDSVCIAFDTDRTVTQTLEWLRPDLFAKGGDSTPDNVPEQEMCKRLGIEVVFGVGGDKIQSSSWLTEK